MTLTEVRTRVRQDLKDTDSANYIWTDAEVDAAIERVVREFSLAYPKQELSELNTVSGSKNIDITTLTNLMRVLSVEFPIDQDPPYLQHFALWGTNITMTDKGDGTKARIKWGKLHTLGDTSTIPIQFDEFIVMGSTAYLAISASAYNINRATIGGKETPLNYSKWGQNRLDRYNRELKRISLNNRVIVREFYTE